ncbi:multicopper oxidase family protein [Pyxidicoccus trucidator]|uniref:multicopper oxidase family protein n=1 Tax=Pyxidicoccus trucidator TaxID=2709662 RepID=UPI0013DB6EDB|nr:multicopper oxidase family protein [Pyxidicoccus trucidator]
MREMRDESIPEREEVRRSPDERDREENDWCEERPNKDVDVRLEVRYALNKIAKTLKDGKVVASDEVRLRSYNGKLVGPVIEVRPGDTLNVFLNNNLPEIPPPPPPPPGTPPPPNNIPHGFNATNLHFHGLHVSPAGISDNVMIAAGPGDRLQYEVKIPRDHAAGTYWYHPHKHGSVTLQVASGMVGALIIRGDIDRVPAIKKAKERIFVFQQIAYELNAQGIGEVERYAPTFTPLGGWPVLIQQGRRFTINGEVEPTFILKPGEVQRWRFIHAGTREPLQVKLVKRDPKTRAEVPIPQYQIALDGITTGFIDRVDVTELHPAYRADVLVRAVDDKGKPLPEGVYWLVDENPAARGTPSRDLARVVVKGGKCEMALPKESELKGLAPFKPIEDDEITGTQEAHFSIDPPNPNPPPPPAVQPKFLINGKEFDPHAPPRKLKLDAVEEWNISSRDLDHPFHIHVNPFMFKRADGRVVWKDTINLAPLQSMKVRTRYTRYIGVFMVHCHILVHADLGMAETMEIVAPRPAHVHEH